MVTRHVSTTIARFEISSPPPDEFFTHPLLFLSDDQSLSLLDFFFFKRSDENIRMKKDIVREREREFETCWRGKSDREGGYNLNCTRDESASSAVPQVGNTKLPG